MANDCGGAKAVVSDQLRDKVEEFISIKPSLVDVNAKTGEPVGDASAVLSGTSSVQGIETLVPRRPVVENLWVDSRTLETSSGQGAVGGVPSSSSPSSGILSGSDSTLGDREEVYSDATTKSAEVSVDDEGARIQGRARVSFSRWSSSSQSVLASLMDFHQGGVRDSDAGRKPSTTELSVLK